MCIAIYDNLFRFLIIKLLIMREVRRQSFKRSTRESCVISCWSNMAKLAVSPILSLSLWERIKALYTRFSGELIACLCAPQILVNILRVSPLRKILQAKNAQIVS